MDNEVIGAIISAAASVVVAVISKAQPEKSVETPDTAIDALVRAAGQFVVQGSAAIPLSDGGKWTGPATRVIVGYPWSPPAGRGNCKAAPRRW